MKKYKKVILIAIVLIALAGIGFGSYYFLIYQKRPKGPVSLPRKVTKEEKKPSPVPIAKIIKKEEKPHEVVLELDSSDVMVRKLAKDLSSHPQLAVWLMNEDLIRRFVAAVDNIANGLSPRFHIEFLAPQGNFQVIKKGGRLYIDPASYKRYNLIVDVFASLDSEGCAKFYDRLKPLFQEAYRELGYPSKDFQEILFKAIIEFLKTPIVEGKILLKKKVITYEMVDPKLEQLSGAQKHLVRMGPQNVRKIQMKLREIALALGIPEDRLPQSRVYYAHNHG